MGFPPFEIVYLKSAESPIHAEAKQVSLRLSSVNSLRCISSLHSTFFTDKYYKRRTVMYRKMIIFILLLILIFQAGCLYAIRRDGPYQGKVVDQETREPIEGVVVLGTWWVYHFSPAGGYSTYYDAHETVTDKRGEFIISGEGLRILSNLQPMHFIVFKDGYKYREGQWHVLKTDVPLSILEEEKIQWDGDMPIFPLKKLTVEEKSKQDSPNFPSDASGHKIKLFLQEINKDRTERGLRPIGTQR